MGINNWIDLIYIIIFLVETQTELKWFEKQLNQINGWYTNMMRWRALTRPKKVAMNLWSVYGP